MGAVLYARRNALGACRKSLNQLAALAACSVTTARKALEELGSSGYISRCRHYRYDETRKRPVYDQYTYHCDLELDSCYTLIPRDLFRHALKNSAFVLCLYLYLRAGNGSRAFPSLNRISRELWMAVSTACRALKALTGAGVILAQFCVKANRAHTSNSYFFLCVCPVTAHAAQVAPFNAGRVSVRSFPLNTGKLPSAAAGPFPYRVHSIPLDKLFQVPSKGRGTFKISKQKLRLR
jgi:DNA-binding transcriptional regulator YhcF (GntR family)